MERALLRVFAAQRHRLHASLMLALHSDIRSSANGLPASPAFSWRADLFRHRNQELPSRCL